MILVVLGLFIVGGAKGVGVYYLSDGNCDNGIWTDWYDRDDPSGNEDNEQRKYVVGLCENVSGIEGRFVGTTTSPGQTTQIVSISVSNGFQCKNAEQAVGQQCQDYEIRYCCAPKSRCPLENVGEAMEVFETWGVNGADLPNLPQCSNQKHDAKPFCDYQGCMEKCFFNPKCTVAGWSQNGNCYLKTDALDWHGKTHDCTGKQCFVAVKCRFHPSQSPPALADSLYVGNTFVERRNTHDISDTQGWLIGRVHLYPIWKMSFDFKPTHIPSAWTSFIHMSDLQNGAQQRVFGIWFHPHTLKPRIHYESNGLGGSTTGTPPWFDYSPVTLNTWSKWEINQRFISTQEDNAPFLIIQNANAYPKVNGLWKKQSSNHEGKPVFKHISHPLYLYADHRSCCHGNWHINDQIEGGSTYYWAGKSDQLTNYIHPGDFRIAVHNTADGLMSLSFGHFEFEVRIDNTVVGLEINTSPIEYNSMNIYHALYWPSSEGQMENFKLTTKPVEEFTDLVLY